MNIGIQLALGLVISALIGGIAYLRRSLSGSGMVGAMIVGTLTFGLGGLSWAMVIVAFFVSSALLTHYQAGRKRAAAEEFAKGGTRDFVQVAANGGVAVLLALASLLLPQWRSIIFAAFVGALATVTADTWATELGLLSKDEPRLVTTWRRTRAGDSGAVTTLGLVAAATGALLIGSVALLGRFVEGLFTDVFASALVWLPTTALVAGWLGSVADSLLGATAQALYYCAQDDRYTEKPVHSCGRPAILTRGFGWLDNDAVNFLASLAGAILGAAVYLIVGR